ncbi:BQ2448_7002 [Microbotryum intermedium]|uniref:BQ2448_7002 protein n=1 Tax=Microbotryum intermedium TaxID=269621 RepID=A0A238FIK9_9BASI|nr:BQ2448_7002 [Microbotryum intermedium]
MSNNNDNTMTTCPTGVPSPPPDPPDRRPKSFAAAVGVTSPSHRIVTATAAVSKTTSHPLVHDIENCVTVKTPPGVTSEQVLVALDKHYPSLAGAMPSTIKGQRALRFPKTANLDDLAANGLTVGKTLCKIEKLLGPSKGGVIQCTLTGFFADPEGVHPSNLPPSFIILERDGVSERIPLRITGGSRHCVFYRSATHVRKDCTVAPLCKMCSQQSHATQHCPRRHAAGSQGSQPLRASAAHGVAAVSAAASATPATPASDRKRRRTDNAPLPPPKVQTDNGRRKPTGFNFTFTSLPGPQAAIKENFALVEKSSESPSSDSASRSQSLAPACLAPNPTTTPTEKPETSNHPPRTANRKRWIKMMTSTKIPNVSFVAANVQSINEDRKRACLLSNLRSHNADVFLLSETGRPTERVAQWTQECRDLKLSALFTPLNNTAILWESDSPVVTSDPESPSNFLRASFAFPDRISDATFRVGESKVRVVSIYAPSSDKPDKKRFLSHLSTTLRRALRDDPSPPALLIGGDWNCVESQLLDSENQSGTNYGGQEMRDLVTANNLSDVYRLHHPKGRHTTNRSAPGTCRRLDRIYVSPDWVDLFHDHKIWAPVLKSTHSMVVARLQVPGAIDIGPGKFGLGLHVIEGDATCEHLSSTVQTLYNEALHQTPDDPKATWTTTEHRLLPQLQALARTLARFRRGGSEQERADHSRYGAALRSRIDPSLAGASSIFICLRKVRASDPIPSLTVDDVVLSDPGSMLGAASDYFERVYQDRPIDDAALEEIIDGLASTRFSPADSHKLERAYSLEEMTKAQESFLRAGGLGPKARQWQGDPLAPSLFVLAIEGFACQIRSRVKGIESTGLQTIRELLFADDACCAVHDHSDLEHLNQAIRLYERASASKLSKAKSFLYPLGSYRDHPIDTHLGTWRLSDSQFRYLGIQVGVDIAEDAGWDEVKSSTIARIRPIPMYDLPYAAKCSIININCYTKILYYNRFLPAPKNVVKEIQDAAMLAIHGRASDVSQRHPMVSRSRLCTPLDDGGFDLIDLALRLAIDQAKWVFQLRESDGCFIRHLFDVRIRREAANQHRPFTLPQPAPNQHRRWLWIWWAYFCHPPAKWNHAVKATRRLLPQRWVRYFEAWATVTTLNPPEISSNQNLERWANHVLFFPAGHGVQLSVNPTLFRGPDDEQMTPASFTNASKRRHAFIFPPIVPEGHQKIFSFPEQRWHSWWKALRKIRRVHSDAKDTAYLLSLDSLHPGTQLWSATHSELNNRSASCVMCLSEAPESLPHLAVGCPFARRLRAALSPSPHPIFADFVCLLVSRSERRIVELRILFFHSIWKLSRRRRFSSQPLEPITESELEELRGSIQGCTGRLASL